MGGEVKTIQGVECVKRVCVSKGCTVSWWAMPSATLKYCSDICAENDFVFYGRKPSDSSYLSVHQRRLSRIPEGRLTTRQLSKVIGVGVERLNYWIGIGRIKGKVTSGLYHFDPVEVREQLGMAP